MYQLSNIIVYPIKSLGGIELAESVVTQEGLLNDRRYMLVDSKGKFVTQRTHHKLSFLHTGITDESILVSNSQNSEMMTVPLHFEFNKPVEVSIWDDTFTAYYVSSLADNFFSEFLQMKVRVVGLPAKSPRLVDTKYCNKENNVGFSDGFPFLIIGNSALEFLNAKLETPLKMNRFRPNLVFTGGLAHDEDLFNEFRCGDTIFSAVKPCARCIMTTIDPSTAKSGKEPLQTLSNYRSINNKIMFGQNLVLESGNFIKVGDKIEVISSKSKGF